MTVSSRVRVADEVWITIALLHRQHPESVDFKVGEIVQRAKTESVTGRDPLRPSIKVHAYLHCVANKVSNSGRYRMFFETARGGGVLSNQVTRAIQCVNPASNFLS